MKETRIQKCENLTNTDYKIMAFIFARRLQNNIEDLTVRNKQIH